MKTTASKLTAMLRRTAAALALTATAAAALVLPTSCKEEKKTDQEKKYVEGVIVPANNVSDCSMSEANITVTFETADAYTLEADKTEMITIAAGQEKGDAAGKHSVRVTISRNDTSDERTGQIFITVKGYNRTLLYQFVQSAGAEDAVVTWIDQRLSKEYYWLDEYNEKRSSFDFSLTYDKFLSSSLLQLTTNEMDGGRNSDGSLNVTARSYTKAITDSLRYIPNLSSMAMDSISLNSIWRTGRYINLYCRVKYTYAARQIALVADYSTLHNDTVHCYLMHNMLGVQAYFWRRCYMSFDINSVWNLQSCKTVRIHLNDVTYPDRKYYDFTKTN